MFKMLRKLLMGLALVGALGCPKPTPTPTPTPTPDLDKTPPKGVAVAPEMLLRSAGARVTSAGQPFNAFMCVDCCNGQPGNRWPLFSEERIDYCSKFGGNMAHARLGPFIGSKDVEIEWADIGGPYMTGTTEFNPAFWQKVRDLTYYAYRVGQKKTPPTPYLVEFATVDTWGCKCDQNGCTQPDVPSYTGFPTAEIQACGRTPSPLIERHIRKAVEELGCFGNVVWSLDVEGGNIGGTKAGWYLWARDVIRDEEQRSGCGFVHMVGTNSRIPEVESQVDYVQTHERTTLSSPIAGRWTINNEHNPEFPVDVEVANFKVARDLGLAWAAWRAGMDDPTYEQVLKGMQAVAAGAGPEPPPGGCYAPGPDDPLWGAATPPSQRAMQLGAQVSQAKTLVGDRCGKNVQESLGLVAGKLREQGLCASGPWVDAVAVRAPDGLYEEHHVVAYSTGCFTSTGNGYKGAWKYMGTTRNQ